MPMCPHIFKALQVTALSATLGLVACGEKQTGADAAKPPVEVSVVTVVPTALPVTQELPGRISSTRIAEVRARVSGIVLERTFKQGGEVRAGDVLFRIDPAPFQAEHDSAKAALARGEATLLQARQQADRMRALAPTSAVSQAQLDNAVAAQKQAEADVAAAKANTDKTRLNLEYATVRAPISGRIGRALVTEGALVGQGDTTHLATIQQLDPIYADFTQPAAELVRLRRALETGKLKSVEPDAAGVKLLLDDGSTYPHPGRLLFSDITVDPGTGQVILRGEFPNPKEELLPGMYVRVQIEQAIDTKAIAVPQQAVQRDATGKAQVFVVGADNKARVRVIKTGRVVDDRWIVEEGLAEGERVIVEGYQKITDGAEVKTVDWKAVSAVHASPALTRIE